MKQLLDFINTHKNWENILTSDPYFLKVEKSGPYVMLNKQPKLSVNNNELVQQAHCTIFVKENDGNYQCVNYPFPHLLSYKDKRAPSIDWRSAYVTQKIEGEMVCIWWHNNKWHFSTETSLSAARSIAYDFRSYLDVIKEAVGGDLDNFTDTLIPFYSYTFILTFPQNKILTDYGSTPLLWYITRLNMYTLLEDHDNVKFNGTIRLPSQFLGLNNIRILKELEMSLEKDEPGYIVADYTGARVRVDGIRYNKVRNLYGNETLTKAKIIEMWQNDELEEWISYFGTNEQITTVLSKLNSLRDYADNLFNSIKDLPENDYNRKLPRFFPWVKSYLEKKKKDLTLNALNSQKKARISDLLADLQIQDMM